jgi:hypothetical protein
MDSRKEERKEEKEGKKGGREGKKAGRKREGTEGRKQTKDCKLGLPFKIFCHLQMLID